MSQITVKLLPSQAEFLAAPHKEVLFSGAYGAGKSKALGYAIARQACIPGNVCLLIRKTLTSLKRSTLLTLIGNDDPVFPKGSYKYNLAESVIKVNGGGKIYVMGVDDPTRIRSINAGFIAVDESIELKEEEYLELMGRLRGTKGSRQIVMATNPALPSHFLYRRFFLDKSPDRKVIQAKTYENIWLPDDYIAQLKTLPEVLYRRYVEGEWCATEQAIYDQFNREIHVQPIKEWKAYDDYVIGCDMGYTHPAAIVLCGVAGEKIHVLREYRKSKQLMNKLSKEIKDMCDSVDKSVTVVCDPSAATLIAQLDSDGFNVVKANNDVGGGINRIRQRLIVRDGSTPDLLINDTCPLLLEEMENYQFMDESEKPVKVNDDLVDALRYAVNHVDDERLEYATPVFYAGE